MVIYSPFLENHEFVDSRMLTSPEISDPKQVSLCRLGCAREGRMSLDTFYNGQPQVMGCLDSGGMDNTMQLTELKDGVVPAISRSVAHANLFELEPTALDVTEEGVNTENTVHSHTAGQLPDHRDKRELFNF